MNAQQNDSNGVPPLAEPTGSPVDSVPAFMRDGYYVVFGIPENPDGTGNMRRGVALVCQSSALHWSGFTLTETGQIIGSINGPWKRDDVLFGYPTTLSEVWRAANDQNHLPKWARPFG